MTAITLPPTPAPNRTQDQTTFDSAWQAFIDWTPVAIAQMNAQADELNALALAASGPGTFTNIVVSGNSALNGDVKSTPVGKQTMEFLPSFATGRIAVAYLTGGSSIGILGFSGGTFGSTVSTPPITLTADPMTKRRRCESVAPSAASNAVGGCYWFLNQTGSGEGVLLSSVALGGGFDFKMRAGPGPGPAVPTCRGRFGLSNYTSPIGPTSDVEPSSILNAMFFGWDSADTNCQIIYRGAGAATKIDLGASFPVPTTARSKLYDIRFFNPRNTNGTVYYEVTDIFTGDTASGSFTHPSAAGTYFNPSAYLTAGGTSVAPGIVFCGLTLEFNE